MNVTIVILFCIAVATVHAVPIPDTFAVNFKNVMCDNFITCPETTLDKRQDQINCAGANPLDYGCGFCNSTNDCNYNGICSTEQYCICDEEHWGEFCQKSRKDKLTAFLLTLIVSPLFGLPPGAGRFYMGYTGYGVAQIILGVSFWLIIIPGTIFLAFGICGCSIAGNVMDDPSSSSILGCISCCGCGTVNMSIGVCVYILGICAELAVIGWWFHDWISILTGSLEPNNGPWGRPDRL